MEHTVKTETVETEQTVKPIVRTVGKEHTHKKKSSSRGTRRFTEIDKRVSKALRRVTRAMDHGVDSYMDHRDKSKENRKDGPAVDFVENVSYGISKAVSEASPIIHDVAEAWNTRGLRTQVRRVARTVGIIPFIP